MPTIKSLIAKFESESNKSIVTTRPPFVSFNRKKEVSDKFTNSMINCYWAGFTPNKTWAAAPVVVATTNDSGASRWQQSTSARLTLVVMTMRSRWKFWNTCRLELWVDFLQRDLCDVLFAFREEVIMKSLLA